MRNLDFSLKKDSSVKGLNFLILIAIFFSALIDYDLITSVKLYNRCYGVPDIIDITNQSQRPPMTTGRHGKTTTSSSSNSLTSALRMCCRVALTQVRFFLTPAFSEEKVEPSNANATFLATCRIALPRRPKKLLLVLSLPRSRHHGRIPVKGSRR